MTTKTATECTCPPAWRKPQNPADGNVGHHPDCALEKERLDSQEGVQECSCPPAWKKPARTAENVGHHQDCALHHSKAVQ